MLATCLIILAAILGLILHRTRCWNLIKSEEKLKAFPGPPGYPIIGCLGATIGSSADILKRHTIFKPYESPACLWIPNIPLVFIYDPVNFQTVANRTLVKSRYYKVMADLLGEGLITAPLTKWKRHRRILDPSFNVNLLKGYFLNIFNAQNQELIRDIAEKTTGMEFDLWPLVHKHTTLIICQTAMGYHCDDSDDANAQKKQRILKYGEILKKTSSIVTKRIMKPWLHSDFIFNIYSVIKSYPKIFEEVRGLPCEIIKQKKEEMKRLHSNVMDNNDNEKDATHKTFIDALLNSEIFGDSDDKELLDEIITFMITGSETSAITVSFTVLMLAMNQGIQEQVYEELQSIYGDSDRPANMDDLRQLVVMERCIKETLRRFSPAPFIIREVPDNIILNDGRVLPADTQVILAILMMHWNDKLYENPDEWRPDRFLPEEVARRHPVSFSPFSTGPRGCIGAKYSMLGVKAQLTSILRTYKFTTDMKMTDIELGFDIVLRNESGYKVYAQPRRVR